MQNSLQLDPQGPEESTPPEKLTVEQVFDVLDETSQATGPEEVPNKKAPNSLPGEDPVSNEGTEKVEATPAATPPTIGRTVPMRIPLPTEGEVLQAAAAVAHPAGPCHPNLCSKEGMKYCFIDEVHAIKKSEKYSGGRKTQPRRGWPRI